MSDFKQSMAGCCLSSIERVTISVIFSQISFYAHSAFLSCQGIDRPETQPFAQLFPIGENFK
jgi:hypothetical protein